MPTATVQIENLRATVGLAQSQLAGQLVTLCNLENKALGMLGVVGALIAADIAGQDALFGRRWWVALIGLGLTAFTCTGVAADSKAAEGPDPVAFHDQFGSWPEDQAAAQMLADLGSALDTNRERIKAKNEQLGESFSILLMTGLYSIFFFTLNR